MHIICWLAIHPTLSLTCTIIRTYVYVRLNFVTVGLQYGFTYKLTYIHRYSDFLISVGLAPIIASCADKNLKQETRMHYETDNTIGIIIMAVISIHNDTIL